MRRSLALLISLGLLMTASLVTTPVSARNSGGDFRSGNRATRADEGSSGSGSGSVYSPDQDSGSGNWPAPDNPPKKVRKPLTWYQSFRNMLLGGLIGSVLLGRKFGGFGLLEVFALSTLIFFAFRALSRE